MALEMLQHRVPSVKLALAYTTRDPGTSHATNGKTSLVVVVEGGRFDGAVFPSCLVFEFLNTPVHMVVHFECARHFVFCCAAFGGA